MIFNIQHGGHPQYHKLWVSNNDFYGIGIVDHRLGEYSVEFIVREKADAEWHPIKHFPKGDWGLMADIVTDIFFTLRDFTSVNPMYKNADDKVEYLLIEELI